MSVFNTNSLLPAVIGAALLGCVTLPAAADDTDIYINPDVPDTSEPLVMFSIDYRPNLGSTICPAGDVASTVSTIDAETTPCSNTNWSSYDCPEAAYMYCNADSKSVVQMVDTDNRALQSLDIIVGAMKIVLSDLSGVKVGLMLNHNHVNNCAGPTHEDENQCSNGGYIPFGFRSISASGVRGQLYGILDSLLAQSQNPNSDGAGHSYQGKELFFEFFRYLTGQGLYNAHVGDADYWKSNYGSTKNQNINVDTPALKWDTVIENGANYASPITSGLECSKIYTINIMFQVSSQEDDSDSAITATKANGGMAGISLSGASNSFPTVIEWLNDTDLADGTWGNAPDLAGPQNVTSYFIVDDSKINVTTTSYAQAGGTVSPLPLTDSPEDLVDILDDVFTQILSVSTTFVSASVPVNVFNRAQVVDNVYIALFQAETTPGWPGNLKKLEIADLESNDPTLIDALGANAIANDGRIQYDALTFWTQTGNDVNGDPLLPDDPADVTINLDRDGRHVNRGAAGQKIPGFIPGTGPVGTANSESGARQLFYDASGSSIAALDATDAVALDVVSNFGVTNFITYNTSVATAADVTTDIVKNQIKWVRGADVDDLDGDGNRTEARPWIFGDPLHSKPLPLNYGALTDSSGSYSASNPAIYIAVASNDGYLRMIRNTAGDAGGSQSGKEIWAFMPRSAMGIQPKLRHNGADGTHPYGFDGTPVALFQDQNQNGTVEAGDSVWLFVGQRRAGQYYYALDVTDPESPSMLWRIGPSGDFADLGYTFSTPQVGRFKYDNQEVYGLVFGGGYDTNKDAHAIGTDDTMGRGVYIVNAETGALIWKAEPGTATATDTVYQHPDLDDSVPSDVTIADTDADGYIDRLVFGDTGGRVWKADLSGTNRATGWQLVELANLGRHGTPSGTKADDRRFFHAADLVQSRDDVGAFDAVILTSGDRADPQDKGGTTTNFGFMIKDRNTVVGSSTEASPVMVLGGLHDITNDCITNACDTATTLLNGWRLQFEETGEKGLAVPLTFDGVIYMTTYLPNTIAEAATCGPAEGSGRLYAVNLREGSPAFDYNVGQDGKVDRYDPLKSGGIPAEVVFLPPGKILSPDLTFRNATGSNRIRTYWQWVEPFDK